MAQSPLNLKESLSNQFLLKFENDDSERDYNEYSNQPKRLWIQIGLIVAALLIIGVEPIAQIQLPKEGLAVDHYVRWYLQFPSAFMLFIFSIISRNIRAIQAAILFGICMLTLSTSSLVWALGPESVDFYNFAILQIIVFGLLVLGLPFRWAFISFSLLLCIHVVVLITFDEIRMEGVLPFQGLLVFFLAISFSAYSVERASRTAFISMVALNEEHEDRLLLQKQRSEWLSVITDFLRHELKNSLLGVTSSLELIRRRNINTDLNGYIRRAENSTGFMKRLLDEASASTSLESALTNMNEEMINLSDLVKDKLDDYREIYADNTFDLSIEGQVFVSCDAERLIQVLDKLINNAVEHSLSDQPIQITLYEKEDNVVLKISDVGEHLEVGQGNIFDPFVSGKSRSAGVNFGFGLYIVKRIVEAHGGEVSAKGLSNPDGAEFTVSFPL